MALTPENEATEPSATGEFVELESDRIDAVFSRRGLGELVTFVRKRDADRPEVQVPPERRPMLQLELLAGREKNLIPGSARHSIDGEALWLARASVGSSPGLSYHWRISACSDVDGLDFEVRVFNRTDQPILYNPGFTLPGAVRQLSADGFSAEGIVLITPDAPFEGLLPVAGQDGGAVVCRFAEPRWLPPRITETFTTRIVLAEGDVVAATPNAHLEFHAEHLVLTPYRSLPGTKLVLLTASGATLEAPADLDQEVPLEYRFAELGGKPQGFVVLAPDRSELLRFPPADMRPTSIEFVVEAEKTDALLYPPNPGPWEIRQRERALATRHWAANHRTRSAFRRGEYDEALGHAEQALLYNGDDPLAWLEKAIAARRLGNDSEELSNAPDLPNAHYLAPLEPMLRAEALMGQPLGGGDEANPLLHVFGEVADELIEVACFYLERGLNDDAVRWMNEAMRVRDLAGLRYLFAAACWRNGLKAEAGASIVAAAQASSEPWLPYRSEELRALAELKVAFPGEKDLAKFEGSS